MTLDGIPAPAKDGVVKSKRAPRAPAAGVQKRRGKAGKGKTPTIRYAIVRPDGVWVITDVKLPSPDPQARFPPDGATCEVFPDLGYGQPNKPSQAFAGVEMKKIGVLFEHFRRAAQASRRRSTSEKKYYDKYCRPLIQQPLTYAMAFRVRHVFLFDNISMVHFDFHELDLRPDMLLSDLWRQTMHSFTLSLSTDTDDLVPAASGVLKRAFEEMVRDSTKEESEGEDDGEEEDDSDIEMQDVATLDNHMQSHATDMVGGVGVTDPASFQQLPSRGVHDLYGNKVAVTDSEA